MLMQVKVKRPHKRKPRLVRGLMRHLILACILFGAAFMYVRQQNSITEMGYELKRLGKQKERLEHEYDALELDLTDLKQPDRILDLVEKYGLNLTTVEPAQTIQLEKPDPIVPRRSNSEEKGDRLGDESRVARK